VLHYLPEQFKEGTMKAKQIFEDAHHTICIYPGRFQPPHRGHAATYRLLEKKYGTENTFIATSNKTDGDKSPFDFAEKKALLIAAGVPAERIVQVVNTYNATEITGQYDLSHTVVLYAVGEKDMGTDPRFSNFTKKDGSPGYLQPMIPEPETGDKHAYLIIAPTVEFKINGKPITSASEIRQMFKNADPAERADIVHQLYGMDTASVLKIFEKKLMPEQPVQDYENTKNPPKPRAKPNKKEGLELPADYTMEQFERVLDKIISEAYSKAEPEKDNKGSNRIIKDPDALIDPRLGAVPARKPTSKSSNSNDELEKELQRSIGENFADGRNPQDKGDSARHGIPKHASVSSLRKIAKQGGRKGQLAHWQANMKAGKKKANENTIFNWAAVPNKPIPVQPMDENVVKIKNVMQRLEIADQQLMDEGVLDAVGRGVSGVGAADSGSQALDAIKQGDWQTALGAGLEAGGSALGMLPKFNLPSLLGGAALSALGSAIKPDPKYQKGLLVPEQPTQNRTGGKVLVPDMPVIRDAGTSPAPNTNPDANSSPNLSSNRPRPVAKKPRASIAT